jgi:hypothetical protein
MDRPPLEVADLVRAAGQAFIERSRKWITWKHIKVLLAIVWCRAAVLGGHLEVSARAADIASSLSIRVAIGTARSVRPVLANAGWKSVAGNFFRRRTCMWSSRYVAT